MNGLYRTVAARVASDWRRAALSPATKERLGNLSLPEQRAALHAIVVPSADAAMELAEPTYQAAISVAADIARSTTRWVIGIGLVGVALVVFVVGTADEGGPMVKLIAGLICVAAVVAPLSMFWIGADRAHAELARAADRRAARGSHTSSEVADREPNG